LNGDSIIQMKTAGSSLSIFARFTKLAAKAA
jgi:hypothetical protein